METKEKQDKCKHEFIDVDNEGFYGKERCVLCDKEQHK